MRRRVGWWLAVLLLLGAGGPWGCASAGPGPNRVIGHITPAHFRFKSITRKDKSPSGWRAVCIRALMRNANTGDTSYCLFEVGVPILNEFQGEVSLKEAKRVCAEQANQAAVEVMSQVSPGEMTAVVCKKFQGRYHVLLGRKIIGAKVSACTTEGVETVLFNTPPPDFLAPP